MMVQHFNLTICSTELIMDLSSLIVLEISGAGTYCTLLGIFPHVIGYRFEN